MGRKPDLTPEEAEEVRTSYYDRNARNTAATLARLYRVNITTIYAVINRSGAYARKYPSKPGEKDA
jgi:Mor family transcriptional regulator